MEEIRLHGRGGQGVVLCSELIALAALHDGKFARAFPWFGMARRGAPVTAFVSIGDLREFSRSMIYEPKHVMVLDPRLHRVLPSVTDGLREGGTYIQNTSLKPSEVLKELRLKVRPGKIASIDATRYALEYMGRPIPNIVMLGAFARVTGLISLDSAIKAVKERFPENLWDSYVKCVRIGYEKVLVEVVKA